MCRQIADAGRYSVGVSNLAGQSFSADALLRVSPTYIIDNPFATVVGVWTSRWLRSSVYGTNYFFKHQGTGDNYVEFAPELAEPGSYQVFEFHPATASHTTNAPHRISFESGSQTISVDQTTNGTRWNLLGAYPFAGGTNGHVRITDAFPDEGQGVGADVIMFVKVLLPLLIAQPESILVSEGGTAQFSVRATATLPVTYQWRKAGTVIATETTPVLVLTNVRPEDAGFYDVVVTNSAGAAVSASAVLSVRPRLKFSADSPGLVLSWPEGFVLQTSTNVAGPYGDMFDATSPHTNGFEKTSQFFRLRP